MYFRPGRNKTKMYVFPWAFENRIKYLVKAVLLKSFEICVYSFWF